MMSLPLKISYELPSQKILNSLKSHKCTLCEKCASCHDCILAKVYLKETTKSVSQPLLIIPMNTFVNVFRQIQTWPHFNDILDNILTKEIGDDPPRYITVGPNNERIETDPTPSNPEKLDVVEHQDDITIDDEETWSLDHPNYWKPKCIETNVDKSTESDEDNLDVSPTNRNFQMSTLLQGSEENPEQIVEKEPTLECKACQKAFYSKKDFDIHSIYHSTEKDHQCEKCEKTFDYSYELIKHKILHCSKNLYYCKSCPKSYPTFEALNLHTRFHTGVKPFVCSVCNKRFFHGFQLKSHFKVHSKKILECQKCEKNFTSELKFLRHQGAHQRIKGFSCFLCERLFSCNRDLKRHQIKIHEIDLD